MKNLPELVINGKLCYRKAFFEEDIFRGIAFDVWIPEKVDYHFSYYDPPLGDYTINLMAFEPSLYRRWISSGCSTSVLLGRKVIRNYHKKEEAEIPLGLKLPYLTLYVPQKLWK